MVRCSLHLQVSARSTDGFRKWRVLPKSQSDLASILGLKEGLPASAHCLLSGPRGPQMKQTRYQNTPQPLMAGLTHPDLYVPWEQPQPRCLDLHPGWNQALTVRAVRVSRKTPNSGRNTGAFLPGSPGDGITSIFTKPRAPYPQGSGQVGTCHSLRKLCKACLLH